MLKQNMVQYTNASVYCFPSRERADDAVKTLCDDRLMSVVTTSGNSVFPTASRHQEWMGRNETCCGRYQRRLPCTSHRPAVLHAEWPPDVIRLLPTSV